MRRRGFTLTELLIALAVLGILGTVLARMLVNDSRFVSRQDAMMTARQTARAALHTMVDELRMVSDSLIAVSDDSVRFRMPYAFGLACQPAGGELVVSLVPSDSLRYANADPTGIAVHDGARYLFTEPVTTSPHTDDTPCTADSVRLMPGGRLVTVDGLPSLPPAGTIVYLYQDVRYRFGPSDILSGRRALWRRAVPDPYEELVAPFDSSAGFRCLVGPELDVVSCPPTGGVRDVRGLELRLVGASEFRPRGESGPETFELVTHVTFLNKVD